MIVSILIPIAGGTALFFVNDAKKRNVLSAAVLFVTILAVILTSVAKPETFSIFKLYDNLVITLFADEISIFFAILFSVIWFLVNFFSFWYIPHAGHEKMFFAIYVICLGPLLGLCFSENLITFYMFFEIMSIVSFFLVIHERTAESKNGGYVYLGYSVFGAGLGLMGLMFMNWFCAGNIGFTGSGNLIYERVAGNENLVLTIVLIMVIGFAGKAGMYPLHSWLPIAHPVAPAPASAVLSGLITKAGVLGVIRVCYNLVGVEFLRGSWVQTTLIIISLTTIFIGSMIAYKTRLLKKRLAYSSVSQVSYVLFGIFLFTPEGFGAALMQAVSHAVSKNLLFICAGAIIVIFDRKFCDELSGLGRKKPLIFFVFFLAALNLVGIPPLPGFFSKWNLATSALSAGLGPIGYIGAATLLVSAILTAGYLLNIVVEAFFGEDKGEVEK